MKRIRIEYFLLKLILFLLCFIILVPVSPALQPIPHRDSGVFLYIGRGILDGKIPYLDFWDHKGPVIYYLDAIGLSLYNDSYWGVWFVELIFLTLSAALGFSLMRDRFNKSSAFVWTAASVLALGKVFTAQFGAGNHVEEYALLFYMIQIFLFLRKNSMPGLGSFYLIGVSAAMCFFLRPNLISPLIGIYVTVVGEMLIFDKANRRKYFRSLFALSGGLVSTLAVVLFYFWRVGAAYDLFHDVIIYNLYYSGSGTRYVQAFVDSFRVLGGILVVGLLAWGGLIVYYKKLIPVTTDHVMARFLIVALPVELVLSLLSGHGYIHYFISWLPALGILSCVLTTALQNYFREINGRNVAYINLLFLTLILVFQGFPLIKDMRIFYSAILGKIHSGSLFITDCKRYPEWNDMKGLYEILPRNSEVMFWGNEVEYNFVMGLTSPSRYIYLYPLMNDSYATDSMKKELLFSLKEKKTAIVDIQPSSVPPLQSLSKWRQYPAMLPVVRYIINNYHIDREFNVVSYYYVDNQSWSVTHKWIIWIHN